uniref:Potassium channel toxin alpha-KTx Tx773 n=1 Tax=Buthus israelis TaxID=2899555 RepID=KA23L_BUTIS|nr:RecName: Full=Potassium channel toxin alpha-KTx Tx773; Flags: Precursor [Buthus occitanus israelis]ACJ23154.1 putative potassium channel toxin Tx773 [Buthus occitanus israelis]
MQKLFIVLLLFCILRLDAEVDGRRATFCKQPGCQEACKKENKNGRCVDKFDNNFSYNICRCY